MSGRTTRGRAAWLPASALGLVLGLGAPTLGATQVTGPGPLADGDFARLNVTATIGSTVEFSVVDLEVAFPAAASQPTASGWVESVGDGEFGGTNTPGDGEAYLLIRANRRLLVQQQTGADLVGTQYQDVLDTQFSLALKGRFQYPVLDPNGNQGTGDYALWNGIVPSWRDNGASYWLGIERARVDATVAELFVRGRIFRQGLLDATDTYTQGSQPYTLTFRYADADGSLAGP